jgi:hypothetical protein
VGWVPDDSVVIYRNDGFVCCQRGVHSLLN